MSIQLKRTTSATSSVVLDQGQPGLLLRTSKGPRLKVGDGTTNWTSLPFVTPDIYIYGDNSLTAPNDTYAVNSNFIVPLANLQGNLGSSDKRYNYTFTKTINTNQVTSTRSSNDDLDDTGTTLQLLSYPGEATADNSTRTGQIQIIPRLSKWDGSKNVYYYPKLFITANDGVNIVLRPGTDGVGSIGVSSQNFSTGYFKSFHISDMTFVDNTIRPNISLTGSLGNPTYRWGTAYVSSINVTTDVYPHTTNTGSVGKTTNKWASGYINDIHSSVVSISNRIVPDTNNAVDLGLAGYNFRNAYVYSIRNQSNTGNGSLAFYSLPRDATSSTNYSSSMSFELQTRYWSNSASTILVHRAVMEPHSTTGTAGVVFRQNAASNQGYLGSSSIPWYRVYAQELHQKVGSSDYKVPVFYSGTTAPASGTGSDGDIFIQYV